MFYLIYVILVVLLGIYFIIQSSIPSSSSSLLEGFINTQTHDNKGFKCPNILIQKGIRYYLYNSKLAIVPGVNPIEFQNLEDYTEFIQWQRSQGIRCPILYLQYSYNAQGEPIYKGRPSPDDLQGGLPPAPSSYIGAGQSSSTPPILTQQSSQNASTIADASANLQKEASENLLHSMSPDAMDDNWGGVEYTQDLINQGVYEGSNVAIYLS